jgi:XTP/dITP diphosphohydrolase
MKICFATRNTHKIKEIQAKLAQTIEVISLDDIGCQEELPETTDTIEGNSLQKAQYIWQNYQTNCFADDSGLEIDALNGEPGVHSAYYAGSRDFDENIALVLTKLGTQSNRKAQFKTVITAIIDGKAQQFTGMVEGEILKEKRGKDGFGYDPIFLPTGFDKTFAEMSMEEKNKMSHRAKAVGMLLAFLKSLNL